MDPALQRGLQALLADNLSVPGLMGLKDKFTRNVPMSISHPQAKAYGGLETWQRGDAGGPHYPRPPGFPLNRAGIQIQDPFGAIQDGDGPPNPVSQKDVLADYVGHAAVQPTTPEYKLDPKNPEYNPYLGKLYQHYASLVNPQELASRVQEHRSGGGADGMTDEQIAQLQAIPEEFRGYTFDQWPPEALKQAQTEEGFGHGQVFSPEQIQILDQIRQYLGIK
jgi:hypothetical protein